MLSAEDWPEIRWLHRSEGLPIKVIARVKSISRNAVRVALADEGPPRYQRRPAGPIVDAAEPRIRELSRATLPACIYPAARESTFPLAGIA